MPSTILLVDDHPVFRQGLRMLLEKDAVNTGYFRLWELIVFTVSIFENFEFFLNDFGLEV